jgi:hypothetical protein
LRHGVGDLLGAVVDITFACRICSRKNGREADAHFACSKFRERYGVRAAALSRHPIFLPPDFRHR